jgi:catechol 2,3-dioxygenase-like lactoylglutathione lyase family enzyme
MPLTLTMPRRAAYPQPDIRTPGGQDLRQPNITMPVKALNHVNIRAGKRLVAELKDFYEGVIGLTEGWRPPFKSTGHWLYIDDVPVVHLVEDELVQASPGSRGPVVDHVSFSCAGLREFEELLERKAIPFRRTSVPGTELVQLVVVDPAGNGVELQFVVGGT